MVVMCVILIDLQYLTIIIINYCQDGRFQLRRDYCVTLMTTISRLPAHCIINNIII